MNDRLKIIEYVFNNFEPVEVEWKLHGSAGNYDAHDVDERWIREFKISAGTDVAPEADGHFEYKESVRLVRYANMVPPLVNVQYAVFVMTDGRWEFLTGHDNGTMTLKSARERYIR